MCSIKKSVSCSLNIGVARVKSALGKQIYAQHHWRTVQSKKKNLKNSTQGKWQETDRKESELTTILLICLIPTVVHAIAVK